MPEPRDEELDDRVRTLYRRENRGDDEARERALARLRREPRPARGFLAFLFAQRHVTVRPALAFAAAVALLGAGVLAGSRLEGVDRMPRRAVTGTDASAVQPAGTPPADVAGTVPVVFALCTPGASSVTVAGDFNSWDAHATPLARAGGDVWMVRVNVPRGVHHYAFVLDGSEWRPDPAAPLSGEPAFGTRSSVLVAGGSVPL